MKTSSHILAKEGILTSFAIAKKVNSSEVKKLRNKLKQLNSDVDLDVLMKEAILAEAHKSLEKDEIPGLLLKKPTALDSEKKKLMELTFFASLISKKMGEKNISKYHSCYIINAIVNMLGLTENDFDEFHEKFRRENSDEDTLE